MSDRHKQARVYVRATPQQAAAWSDAAASAGVPLNTLAATALDSFVASLRTAKLRGDRAALRAANVQDPCDDAMCSLEYNHKGKCNFGRP